MQHASPHELARARLRRLWPWPLAVGTLIAAVWLWATGARAWPTARDLNQHRANMATAVPDGARVLNQTFTPRRNGLSEVELLLVRYGDGPTPDESGALLFDLSDAAGRLVASAEAPTAALRHNQTYALRFAPQPASAGQLYTLTVRGRDNTAVALWGYSLDVLADGRLAADDGAIAPQDVRLIARYTLDGRAALTAVGRALRADLPLLLAAAALLWLPGALLLPRRTAAGWLWTADALALGAAVWPLLWLWPTLIGWRWSGWSLWAALGVGWGVVLGRAVWRARRAGRPAETARRRPDWQDGALAAVLALGGAARLLAVRDLAFPPWVDSTRHALITAVMAQSGQFPADYHPWLAVDAPLYHFGFHTLSAGLQLLVGGDLAGNLLVLGQLLNALTPLAVYAAARRLLGRRGAALVAAWLVALPFFFPGYYASWGRFTQLTGMLILPVLIGRLWETARSERPLRGEWAVLGALAAGLFLVHFRVFLLMAPFGLLVGVWRIRRAWRPFAAAAALALLLVAPRLVTLARNTPAGGVFGDFGGYNDFPTGYVQVGWERAFWLLGGAALSAAVWGAVRRIGPTARLGGTVTAGVLLWLGLGEWLGRLPLLWGVPYLRPALGALVAAAFWRAPRWRSPLATALLWLALQPWLPEGRDLLWLLPTTWVALAAARATPRPEWARAPLLLAGWTALLIGALLGRRIGLPETWVVNLNSLYIALYLPLALVLGAGAAVVWDWLRDRAWLPQLVGYALCGGLLAHATLFGLQQQATLINEQTVLAEAADRPALDWLRAHAPADARVAVSSWLWLNGIWAAQDGGAWITPLTGLAATTPPADYSYAALLIEQVNRFNAGATAVADWSTAEAADFLRAEGVTHLFVGARGGFLNPAQLAANPAVELLYGRDGAFVFRVQGTGNR